MPRDTLFPKNEASLQEAMPSRGAISESEPKKKIPFFLKVLGALAVTSCLVYGADVAYTYSTDTSDSPAVHELSGQKNCSSKSAQVYSFSGAGRETSEFFSRNLLPVASRYDVCLNYSLYGSMVDVFGSAKAINDNNCRIAKENKRFKDNKVNTVIRGVSTGTMIAQEVMEIVEILPDSCTKISGVILESPLTGEDDIKNGNTAASLVVENKMAYFGKWLLAAFNTLDIHNRGDVYTERTVFDAYDNAMNTRPPLVKSQLEYIKFRPTSKMHQAETVVINSLESDNLLNVAKVNNKIDFMMSGKQVTINIPDAGHDLSWLDFHFPRYEPAYEQTFRTLYPEYVLPSTTAGKPKEYE